MSEWEDWICIVETCEDNAETELEYNDINESSSANMRRYARKQRPQAVKGFRSIENKMAENWSAWRSLTGRLIVLELVPGSELSLPDYRDEEILNREVVRNYYYGQRGTSLRLAGGEFALV